MSNERISDKSLKFDWFFICVTLTLMTFGVFLVYSATVGEELAVYDTHWFRQIIYFLTGIAIAVGLVFVKIDWLKRVAVPSYVIALFLLLFNCKAIQNRRDRFDSSTHTGAGIHAHFQCLTHLTKGNFP